MSTMRAPDRKRRARQAALEAVAETPKKSPRPVKRGPVRTEVIRIGDENAIGGTI